MDAEVLATNGLQDAVRVLEAHSSSLSASELGFGGGARCDVLVSEVLDDGLLGEHVIPTVAHARRQLCTSDALVIPARAAVRARLVSVPRQAAPVPAPSAAFGGAMVDSGGNGAAAVGWDTLDVSAYDALRPKCAARYFSARMHRLRVYAPSTIAVFGENTPKAATPEDTITQPTTMYGLTKVRLSAS